MGKIIPFRQSYTAVSGYPRYKTSVEQGKSARPRKEPIIITVMPDQPFPVRHEDLRPFLQRDGLILMSWARWEDWEGDGSLLQRYVVNWLASSGKYHHYASGPVERKSISEVFPSRRGDPHFYRGLYGKHFNLEYYGDEDTADYVYLTAPFDLSILDPQIIATTPDKLTMC